MGLFAFSFPEREHWIQVKLILCALNEEISRFFCNCLVFVHCGRSCKEPNAPPPIWWRLVALPSYGQQNIKGRRLICRSLLSLALTLLLEKNCNDEKICRMFLWRKKMKVKRIWSLHSLCLNVFLVLMCTIFYEIINGMGGL